jgi:hypothetical protein
MPAAVAKVCSCHDLKKKNPTRSQVQQSLPPDRLNFSNVLGLAIS